MRAVIILAFMSYGAAAVQPELPTWEHWLLQGGAFAALLWVLYHMITKVLPNQQKLFSDSLNKLTDTFKEEVSAVRRDQERLDDLQDRLNRPGKE